MADGYFPTLISKDKDPNIVTNPVFVELSDGSTAAGFTGTSLNVNLTNSSVAVTGTFWQTTQPVSGTFWQTTQPVSASDLDIRNLTLADDAVKISANATVNSASNPIFVSVGAAVMAGEVHSYYDVATSTNNNHDYPVVTAMLVKGIECSSSGAAKFELQTGPVATLVAKWTGLIPKQGGTISVKFDPPIEVPVTSTGTVRILRTNRESQSQNMYTTIMGIDA